MHNHTMKAIANSIEKISDRTLAVLGVVLTLVSLSAAQFKVSDNFNRADGVPGLGWSTWGNGAQVSTNQLETFGEVNVAGGIQRILDVTFPLTFSFDFSTAAPADGGWLIGFNAIGTTIYGGADMSEVRLFQNNGGTAVCTFFQTVSGPSTLCGNTVSGQRIFTAKAHVSVTLRSDFSVTVVIKYNDGLLPAQVVLKTPAPVGAIQTPQGNVLFLGNANMTYGPHFFDNFVLSLN
jgi:hypothetical protein